MIEQIPAINLTGTDPRIPGWQRETTFLNAYPPEGEPNVFVIGAYNGGIAGVLIRQLPDAEHWLFEPQDWAAEQLRGKFGHLANVHVREFGLGDRSGTLPMGSYGNDGCSFMRGPTPTPPGAIWFDGRLVEFDEFMRREGLSGVYHTSMNIEAYEYVLLPHLVKTGWLERCQTIGISWHDCAHCGVGSPYTYLGQSVPCWYEMQELLAKDHDLVLSIDNWQSWVRRGT